MKNMSTDNKLFFWLLMAFAAAILSFFGYYHYVLPDVPDLDGCSSAAIRGQYGDAFGGMTAFFGTLSFLLLIYTVIQQHREIEMTREALDISKEELEKTNELLDLQKEEMKESQKIQQQLLCLSNGEAIEKNCNEEINKLTSNYQELLKLRKRLLKGGLIPTTSWADVECPDETGELKSMCLNYTQITDRYNEYQEKIKPYEEQIKIIAEFRGLLYGKMINILSEPSKEETRT